jgi:hypothetical protein
MSVPGIRATAMVLIVGGNETTVSTLSAIILYLLQNTSIYRTFVQEIRDSLGKDEYVTVHNLTYLKYLNAVINEGLRIYPRAPLRRLATTSAGKGRHYSWKMDTRWSKFCLRCMNILQLTDSKLFSCYVDLCQRSTICDHALPQQLFHDPTLLSLAVALRSAVYIR